MKKSWALITLTVLLVGGAAALYAGISGAAAIEVQKQCSINGITNVRPGTEAAQDDWPAEPRYCDYWYWKRTGEPVHIEDFFGDGDGYLEACEFVNLEGWWYHLTSVEPDCFQLEHLFG